MMTTSDSSRDLLARLAGDAASGNEFGRNRPDIVEEQTMPRGLEMAGHRTPHDPEADEADIDHF